MEEKNALKIELYNLYHPSFFRCKPSALICLALSDPLGKENNKKDTINL